MPYVERMDVAPYGTWESPVAARLIAAGSKRVAGLVVDAGTAYWYETLPAEGGRGTVMRWMPEGGVSEATPASANVGTRVHEMGGPGFSVRDGRLVYSERSDNSVWLIEDGEPRCIVRADGCRYADFNFTDGCIYAIREDFRNRPATNPKATIVALRHDPATVPERNDGTVMREGEDFYACLRLSPDETTLAWIEWDLGRMHFDATRLRMAQFERADRLGPATLVAGGDGDEAVAELAWAPDSRLCFSTDRDAGWWNVHTIRLGSIENVCPVDAEIGTPPWWFGARSFTPLGDERFLCTVVWGGQRSAGLIENGRFIELGLGPVAEIVPFGTQGAVFISAPHERPAELHFAPDFRAPHSTVIAATSNLTFDPADIATSTALEIPTTGGETTHVFFYPPCNARFTAPPGELPPLIITSHGGPTACASNEFNLAIAWFTSRGFAVADVNYRGSTGFGREYRDRLKEAWGILDVDDCVAAARALAERRLVDGERIAIRGGSASGFTALAALERSDLFAAAASYYGVADLESLAQETHKLESRYLDYLIGPLPQARERYRERSPIHHVDELSGAVILFQGLEDKVVPPSQATEMAQMLAAAGKRVALYQFAGEGHGFRIAETIARTLELELAFYGDVFGFRPAAINDRVTYLASPAAAG